MSTDTTAPPAPYNPGFDPDRTFSRRSASRCLEPFGLAYLKFNADMKQILATRTDAELDELLHDCEHERSYDSWAFAYKAAGLLPDMIRAEQARRR